MTSKGPFQPKAFCDSMGLYRALRSVFAAHILWMQGKLKQLIVTEDSESAPYGHWQFCH